MRYVIKKTSTTVTITDVDGSFEEHPINGVVFGKGAEHASGEYDSLTIYSDYLAGGDSVLKSHLIAGVQGVNPPNYSDSDFNAVYHYALVRRGNALEGTVQYYPLPLVFATPEERDAAANSGKFHRPPERWVRRKQAEVLRALGL